MSHPGSPPRNAVRRWLEGLPTRRVALGLTATATPTFTFVLVGVALGPQVLGLIPPVALARFDPVVSVALAMLGVFVGLELGSLSRSTDRLLFGATVEVMLATAIVAGIMYLLLAQWGVPLPAAVGPFAAALGICSGASAATRVADDATPEVRRTITLADLSDVPLIVLGAVALDVLDGRPSLLTNLFLTIGAGTGVGIAGWLLFERASNDAERGVFVAGAIVILGGVGAYVGGSPLLAGCAAAVVWVRTPGAADRIIAADVAKLQHPLVALLLIVAGASIQWTMALTWIAAALVLFRLSGKLLAGAAAAAVSRVPVARLVTSLMPPGVIGIALALNFQQVLRLPDTLLLSSVTLAAMASEILGAALADGREDRL
jgi:hypothetical protein